MTRGTPIRVLLMATVFILIASACGKKEATTETPKAGGTIKVELGEPGPLDAQLMEESEQILVGRQCYRGMIAYDSRTAKVLPAVAERWDITGGGTEITFHLRKDAKWSNGEAVDANSFIRGWSFATSKAAASPVAYHLSGIKGYDDQQTGKTTTLAGLTAIDQNTLKVTLTAADAEFVVKTGHPVFSPRPTDAAIAAQAKPYGDHPLCNGPFAVKEWKHNQFITLERNANFYGAKPFLDSVNIRIFADQETAYTEWKAGGLDWTRIPPESLREAQGANPNNWILKPVSGFDYLSMNIKAKPTNNADFRRAVSQAIDRKAISDAIFGGTRIAATGIIPPVLPGYRAPDANGVGACKYCKLDVTAAKAALDKAKAAGVDVTKPVQMSYNSGAGHERWIQAAGNQLKTNLGLNVTYKGYAPPFSSYLKYLKTPTACCVNRLAWGMDYPTPDNFLYPLLDSEADADKGGDNYSHYNNKQFDDLIAQARSTADDDQRLKLYQQAEDVALEDVPFVPMFFRVQFRLVHLDKFGGLSMDPFEDPTLETTFVKGTASS